MTGEVVYNTGNPVPSADAYDRYDNTRVFDSLVNLMQPTVTGRTGETLVSWFGIQQQVNNWLAAQGFESIPLVYVDGTPLTVDRPTQLITRGGFLYSVQLPSTFPVVLSGNWVVDQPLLRLQVDQDLRGELADALDPSKGAALVGYSGSTVTDRLGKYKLVTDYLAKGLTVADAVADAPRLRFPAGTYTITGIIPLSSGQRISLDEGAVLRNITPGNTQGIFSIAAGVSDVAIFGPGALTGPYTSTTPAPAPSYPNGNGAIRINGTYDNRCSDIKVEGVRITGWGDYGIFAENVVNGAFNLNKINLCGRDGIRFYGALYTTACLNRISDISPGVGGVAPNLNVYGITFTRRPTAGTDLTLNPPSRFCIAANNIITNCNTWKGLDTHGGQDLLFANNIIGNCHIGIGIDEGDTTGATDAPPVRIKVIGNSITRGSGNPGGAGINMSSSNASNMGTDNELTSNTITGHGGVSTGAINIAYQARPLVSNNLLVNSSVAGINVPGSVRVTSYRFSNNTVQNLLDTALAAVAIQTGEADGVIDGITLVRESGTFFGFSLATPSSGYQCRLGGEIIQRGSMTLFAGSSALRLNGGGFMSDAKAIARVTSDGTLVHSFGVVSSSQQSTGVYDVTLEYTGNSNQTLHAIAIRRNQIAGMVSAVPISSNVVRVCTFNASGAASNSEFDVFVYGV